MEFISIPIAFKDVFYNGFVRRFCRFAPHYLDALTESTTGFSEQNIADCIQDRDLSGPGFSTNKDLFSLCFFNTKGVLDRRP